MRLEDIIVGGRLMGVVPGEAVDVVSVTPITTEAVTLVFRGHRGLAEVVLDRSEEAELTVAALDQGRPFTADPDLFRLAAEARRIESAAASADMVAVTTSTIDPLPHQISAVYDELLPRTPLRFLLADDPGAGKTIMAGLYIKELKLRRDVQRCLVVAPGGLVEQWQDELRLRFNLHFDLLTRDLMDAGPHALEHRPLLIARMDQLARNEDWLAVLADSDWDLVVVDEAHRMSAHWFGNKLEKSRRYRLGELLAERARHLLLMTATPHAGKDEDFNLFLALLDPDRFAGKSGRVDSSGVMRRMVKEDLLTFEGRKLFPNRVAETVPYELTEAEQRLYDHVSDYVREEMNRADRLDGKRRSTVGFALTVLQRRLASSPEAIYQSLRRRSDRLRKRRDDLAAGRVPDFQEPSLDLDDLDDELNADDLETLEQEVSDAATSAQTVAELEAELVVLDRLVAEARELRLSGADRKWNELRRIFTDEALDRSTGHKLIIFTEHRDTLDYLTERIRTLLGAPEAVETIHGGVSRPERRRITEEFSKNPACRVLLATDAAGEGLNLQAAHLMVNYDLPWNPNRIEQRFGRVHRIGQTHECRLWNLVAENTREGDVFTALLAKIERQRQSYGGKVFDVLGETFREVPLRTLLLDAIRRGDDPAVRAEYLRIIDDQAGAGMDELLREQALAAEVMPSAQVDELRQELEQARLRRLQPHFIEWSFRNGLAQLGGRLSSREPGRFEISHVPALLRSAPTRQDQPVARAYSRVTFDPDRVEPEGPDGRELDRADLLAPGHPLHDAVMAAVTQRWGSLLGEGAVFLSSEVDQPHLLVVVEQALTDGTGATLERSTTQVLVDGSGRVTEAELAPYLGWDPAPAALGAGVDLGWVTDAEQHALAWAVGTGGPARLGEVRRRRGEELDREMAAVTSRLTGEANRLSLESVKASQSAGSGGREQARNLMAKAEEMEARLAQRAGQVERQKKVHARPPTVVLAALVLPDEGSGALETGPQAKEARAKQTKAVERRAVEAVMAAERALGRHPVEQAFNNKGFDILSESPGEEPIHLEVKGRIKGSDDFEVTISEALKARNAAPRYRLALVSVDPDDPARDEVRYLDDPFSGFAVGSFSVMRVRGDWHKEWAKGRTPF